MLRHGLLWLSERQEIFNFVRKNRVARSFARRFVAGETVEEAVDAALELRRHQITSTLDLLGESVTAPNEARAARDHYLNMVRRLASGNLEVNVSVKLTQMGLDIDEDLCAENMMAIVEAAAAAGGFVRIDMESSEYTDRTLAFHRRTFPKGLRPHVGVVIQTSLRRSAGDIEELIAGGTRVRLCKGAYLEPEDVAYPAKADVDRQYVALMERLLLEGTYPGLATHDERILNLARAFIIEHHIPPERYEFQMLYGVRRDLQRELRSQGHRVRVYIPFGRQWYPYLMRRLAERPANIAFIMSNIFRESMPRL